MNPVYQKVLEVLPKLGIKEFYDIYINLFSIKDFVFIYNYVYEIKDEIDIHLCNEIDRDYPAIMGEFIDELLLYKQLILNSRPDISIEDSLKIKSLFKGCYFKVSPVSECLVDCNYKASMLLSHWGLNKADYADLKSYKSEFLDSLYRYIHSRRHNDFLISVLKQSLIAIRKLPDYINYVNNIIDKLSSYNNVDVVNDYCVATELSIVQILNNLSILIKLVERYGIAVIGIVETEIANNSNYELNEQDIVNKLKITNEQIISRIGSIESLVGGWILYDLVSKTELMEEGSYQSHCVGGYSEFLREGRGKIFSLRKEDERITIAFTKQLGQYVLNSAQGKYNSKLDRLPNKDKSYVKANIEIILNHLNEEYSKNKLKEARESIW